MFPVLLAAFIDLPTIVEEYHAPENANTVQIVQPFSGRFDSKQSSGSGSIVRQIGDDLPIPVLDSGSPGGVTQIRGFGKSSEETSVEFLGVPMNPGQGGGFDFSVFPSYLWSGYEFQITPSAGSGGLGGQLDLMPWTAYELGGRRGTSHSRMSFHFIPQKNSQFSVGTSRGGEYALLLGLDSGKKAGPSGSLSTQFQLSPKNQTKFHLLASQQQVSLSGTLTRPTPRAQQDTLRWIPIVVNEWQVSDKIELQTTVYADYSRLKYSDPDSSFITAEQSQKLGVHETLHFHTLRVYGKLDQTRYEPPVLKTLQETKAQLGVSKPFFLDSNETLSLQPDLQWSYVSKMGGNPQGSLNLTHVYLNDSTMKWNSYVVASYSKRYPSLIDRYYEIPWFRGNPSLKPESALSLGLGTDLRRRKYKTWFNLFLQMRSDTQLQSVDKENPEISTMINRGNAYLISISHKIKYSLTNYLDLSETHMIGRSFIQATGSEFPMFPRATEILGAELHSNQPYDVINASETTNLASIGLFLRATSSSASFIAGRRIAGTASLDLRANVPIVRDWHLSLAAENLLDRPITVIDGMPPERRTIALSLNAFF